MPIYLPSQHQVSCLYSFPLCYFFPPTVVFQKRKSWHGMHPPLPLNILQSLPIAQRQFQALLPGLPWAGLSILTLYDSPFHSLLSNSIYSLCSSNIWNFFLLKDLYISYFHFLNYSILIVTGLALYYLSDLSWSVTSSERPSWMLFRVVTGYYSLWSHYILFLSENWLL